MRVNRVKKFKKRRHTKMRKLFLATVFLPCASIFIGYLITALIILPTIRK